MKSVVSLFVLPVVAALLSPTIAMGTETRFGANFNKSPEDIDVSLLSRGESLDRVQWVRASINMFELLKTGDLDTTSGFDFTASDAFDSKFDAIREANLNQHEVILTLRWDFRTLGNNWNQGRAPLPDHGDFQIYMDLMEFVLTELDGQFDILVLGNEPVLETRDIDQVPKWVFTNNHATPATLPALRTRMDIFYEQMLLHLVDRPTLTDDAELFFGAFNKLHRRTWRVAENGGPTYGWDAICTIPLSASYDAAIEGVWEAECPFESKRAAPGIANMIALANHYDDVDGIDLHIHVGSMDATEQQLAYADDTLAHGKDLIVTEFSLIYAFKTALPESVCGETIGAPEQAFCNEQQHALTQLAATQGIPCIQDMTTLDLVNITMALPACDKPDRAFWESFYTTRSYLPQESDGGDYMTLMADLMNHHGVSIATYGFTQGNTNNATVYESTRSSPYTVDGLPWLFNPLYAPVTIESIRCDGPPAARSNPYFYPTFRMLPH